MSYNYSYHIHILGCLMKEETKKKEQRAHAYYLLKKKNYLEELLKSHWSEFRHLAMLSHKGV